MNAVILPFPARTASRAQQRPASPTRGIKPLSYDMLLLARLEFLHLALSDMCQAVGLACLPPFSELATGASRVVVDAALLERRLGHISLALSGVRQVVGITPGQPFQGNQ